jgi:cytochrome c biogenesis protein CcdA
MSQLLEAFLLGNAAILGNVCLLPLYPGLFALLAARAESSERSVRFLGVWVLAGVLVALGAVAAVLSVLNAVFADVVPFVLPFAYGGVIVLGIAMLLDRNPLARLGTGQVPVVSSNAGSAFVYGVALGPMTLPCTGPVILAAFVLGGVAGTGAAIDQAVYFLFFGLGFGWPLVALPLLAGARQRQVTGWLTRNHRTVTLASGALLVAVAIVGLVVEYA